MSNKLYTEESIKQSLLRHRNQSFFMNINQIDYLISELTPIELPTYEELIKISKNIISKNNTKITEKTIYIAGFLDCAKWMRDKIQGGNK